MRTEPHPLESHLVRAQSEHGTRVSVTRGLEKFELSGEGEEVGVRRERHIAARVRHEGVHGEVFRDVSGYIADKLLILLRLYGQSRRLRVSSETRESVRELREHAEDVDALHRPRRALVLGAFTGEQHGGTEEVLREPRGGDAEHARLPMRRVQDYDMRIRKVGAAEHGFCLGDHLLAHLLAAGIIALELLGQRFQKKVVLFEEEVGDFARRPESPRGVDARSDAEHDILRSELVPREHFQALSRRGVVRGYAVGGDDAVVAPEGHHIRHRRERAYIEIAPVLLAEQRADELQRDPRSAIVRKAFPVRLGVDDYAIRDAVLRLVMVGDDDIYALALQIFHLGGRRYAAVHGDHEIGTALRHDAPQRAHGHAVAVGQSVGDEVAHIRPAAQREHEQTDRAYAVAVVVAEDEYLLSGVHGAAQSRRSLGHSRDIPRGRERGQRRTEERGDLLLAYPSRREQREQPLGYPEFRRSLRYVSAPAGHDRLLNTKRLRCGGVLFHFFFLKVVFFLEYL